MNQPPEAELRIDPYNGYTAKCPLCGEVFTDDNAISEAEARYRRHWFAAHAMGDDDGAC